MYLNFRQFHCCLLSLVVEHSLRKRKVEGSIPSEGSLLFTRTCSYFLTFVSSYSENLINVSAEFVKYRFFSKT